MLASLFNVCEDRVIPHIFAEFLIFIALSSKARVMIQISSLVSVIVLSIIFCPLGWGGRLRPWGLPLIPNSYKLISYTQSLPIVFHPKASASSLVSNCLTILGDSFGSIGSCTNIYFFIPCNVKLLNFKIVQVYVCAQRLQATCSLAPSLNVRGSTCFDISLV